MPYSKGSPGPENYFSAYGHSKNWTWNDCENDISRGRLALRINFQPLGRTKMRLGQGRERNVSMGRLVLRNHFLLLIRHNIRLRGRLKRDV
jgi:hypothetical protein